MRTTRNLRLFFLAIGDRTFSEKQPQILRSSPRSSLRMTGDGETRTVAPSRAPSDTATQELCLKEFVRSAAIHHGIHQRGSHSRSWNVIVA